jgi:predicted DNA-binding transcriptional regulator YafY
MPRNAEVIRQWTILREIERARTSGVTIDELAILCDVTTRTIRRDFQALEEAGFPLYDERDDNGRAHWRLEGQVLKGLETGFTLAELCAL